MSKCIICGKDCVGECCSGACRAKKSRRAHAHVPERTGDAHGVTIIDEAPNIIPKQAIDLAHRRIVNKAENRAGTIEPCMRPGYVCPIPEDQRKPGINYGLYMTANELAAAGLRANRVSVPGDEDYQRGTQDEEDNRSTFA